MTLSKSETQVGQVSVAVKKRSRSKRKIGFIPITAKQNFYANMQLGAFKK